MEPDIPPAYRKLETIYRPENVTTRQEDVDEISKQTGLSPQELVVFKPERLVLHELIVRVTTDILVPEGDDEIELGRSFRRIARQKGHAAVAQLLLAGRLRRVIGWRSPAFF